MTLAIVKSVPAINNSTRANGVRTICFPTGLAVFAGCARILNWPVSGSHSDFELLNSVADLDDDAGPFMACTFDAHFRHFGHCQIVHHQVDIGEADTGGIELDEDVFRTWLKR
jgi:hypothetical protein